VRTSAGAPANLPSVIVQEVLDGDSLVVVLDDAETEIRLAGVNAPERDECFHPEATDRLGDLVAGGTVLVERIGVDQFDRVLARLWRDGDMLNLDMVSTGHAIAVTPEEGDLPGELLLEAEEEAFAAGAGLWADDACGAPEPIPLVTLEVVSDPAGPDDEALEGEIVAISSAVPLDLGGWTIRDESSAHRCLLPDRAVTGTETALTITSADSCWAPGDSPVWNNAGDMALLVDEAGRVAARHRYRS
jgi:endonuclease YncB( thermonuclease family)